MDTDRGPGRAGAHAGRPAPQARAAVAFHRGLGDFLLRPAAEPAQQARLGSDLGELDHPVRTVLDTIAATDAGIRNGHLAVRKTVDGIGRAILHAMGMLAVPA